MLKNISQEGIKSIENVEKIAKQNNFFYDVLLRTMLYAILQPLWVGLVHFWNI